MLDEVNEVSEAIKKAAEEDEKHLTRHDDGRVTVILETPVDLKMGNQTRTIEEITARRAKGKDWAATDRAKGEIGKTRLLAASVTGEPKAVFEEMDGEDFLRVTRVVTSMGKSPTGGGTSSET